MERIDYKVKIAVIPIDTNFKIVFFIYFFEFYRISKKYYRPLNFFFSLIAFFVFLSYCKKQLDMV